MNDADILEQHRLKTFLEVISLRWRDAQADGTDAAREHWNEIQYMLHGVSCLFPFNEDLILLRDIACGRAYGIYE